MVRLDDWICDDGPFPVPRLRAPPRACARPRAQLFMKVRATRGRLEEIGDDVEKFAAQFPTIGFDEASMRYPK